MKKLIAMVLTVVMVLGVTPVSVHAARDYAAEIAEMEQIYGFRFLVDNNTYEKIIGEDGKPVTINGRTIFDRVGEYQEVVPLINSKLSTDVGSMIDVAKKALEMFPPGLIKEVTDRITLLEGSPPFFTIVPKGSTGGYASGGINGVQIPEDFMIDPDRFRTVIHEIVHVIYYNTKTITPLKRTDLKGIDIIDRQFLLFNYGIDEYKWDEIEEKNKNWKGTFVSKYATLSMAEDFADTWAYLYVSPNSFVNDVNNPSSPIAKKKAYIEELLISCYESIDAGTKIWPGFDNSHSGQHIKNIHTFTVTYNGQPISYTQAPIYESEIFFVPLKETIEALGGSFTWNAFDNKGTVTFENETREFTTVKFRKQTSGQIFVHNNQVMAPINSLTYGYIGSMRFNVAFDHTYNAATATVALTPKVTTPRPTPTPSKEKLQGEEVRAVVVNGKTITLGESFSPQNFDGVIFTPPKQVLEAAGIKDLDWEILTHTITFKKDKTTLAMQRGSKTAKLNGKTVAVEHPVFLHDDGHINVPLQFVIESFGGSFKWDESTQTVTITLK